jgi:hypothetical protein
VSAVARGWGSVATKSDGARRLSARGPAAVAVLVSAALVALLAPPTPASAATINVHCPQQDLQTKIDSAPGGATLLITGTCVGNFFLDKNLTLKGNPTATLDGNDSGTTLTIPNTHTVHLIDLTITGGRAAVGAGINHNAGILTLNRVTVENNLARGPTFAQGGGINTGNVALHLTASKVIHNWAVGTDGAGATVRAAGIAMSGSGSALTIVGSSVSDNRSAARPASGTAFALGGGIFLSQGTLDATNSHIDGNHATAVGPSTASAVGGAIEWDSPAAFSIQDSTLNGNVITARTTGAAQASAVGGAIQANLDVGAITDSVLANNQATAISFANSQVLGGAIFSIDNTMTLTPSHIMGTRVTASGGTLVDADGGGIDATGGLKLLSSSVSTTTVRLDSGSAQATAIGGGIRQTGGQFTLSKSSIDQNHLIVSSSGANAVGLGGGVIVGSAASIVASTISRNTVATTAAGTKTAQSTAAGVSPQGTDPQTIKNSTIASNVAHAESDPATGTANAFGGGLFTNSTTLRITNTTLARNLVGAQANTTSVQGGGIKVVAGTTTLEATILALNTAPLAGGPNCSGAVASDGRNLLGTTSGCTFATQVTDKVGLNPKLGQLANNGGPTPTLALLTGSPALNVIPTPCAVTVDQRGVHRPQGPKCDIGSFERKV